MERLKIIEKIENGKQVGITKIVIDDNKNICYTYAIQKKNDKYIVYIDEYCLDTCWESDKDTSIAFIYDSLLELEENCNPKYGINFEQLNVSKGHKFFNENIVRI